MRGDSMKRVKLIFINLVVLTATALLLRTASMAFQVYLSNKIGAEGIGLFQLIMSVYFLAVTFAVAGVRLAVTRLVAEELGKGNSAGAKRALGICLRYSLTLSLLLSLLLFFGAEYIGINWLSDRRTILSLRLLSLTLPFLAASSVYGGYFTAVRRAAKAAAIQVGEQFIRIPATILLLIYFSPADLESAAAAVVIGAVLGELASFLMLFIAYRLDIRRYKNGPPAPSNLYSRMSAIILPVAVSAYITSGLRTLQQLLVPAGLKKSGASGSAALATYGVIHGMVLPILMFPAAFLYAVSDLIIPELAECQATGSKNRLNYIANRVLNLSMLSSMLVMCIFFRYSHELGILIYSSDEAAYFLRILAPLIIILYMDSIVDGMLKGIGEQVRSMLYNILESSISVLLIYFLLPRYAINGYIFTVFIARALNFILSIRRLCKVAMVQVSLSLLVKAGFAMVNSVILTNFLFYSLGDLVTVNFPWLIAQIACISMTFYMLLRALGCIKDEELYWFKSVFSS